MDTTADAYMYAGVRMMEMWLESLLRALPAISIVVTSIFASLGLNAWRRQLVGKRHFELAEDILVTTLKVRSVFRAARSPLVFVGEGKTRRRVEGEPDKFTDLRDSYFVLIERLEKHDETMTRFDALRVMARAHWGVEAEKPFSEILLSYLDVGMAARMMIAVVEEPPQNTRDLRERWRTAAWAAVDGTDEISRRVNDAVDQVEALCRKHLR